MNKTKRKTVRRDKIRRRIRSTISGTEDQPRFSIYKSNKHVYAQLIDDLSGRTLASVSTQSKNVKDEIDGKTRKEAAEVVGKQLAAVAQEKGINNVVFDRSGYRYHGVVKALAEGARDGGLDF
jgi:large subunit ribosomal protein L18